MFVRQLRPRRVADFAVDGFPSMRFQAGRPLDASVWEASLLVFLPDLGLANSMFTIAGLLLNAATQFTFTVIAFTGFTVYTFPSVDDAKMWRYGSAHDYLWVEAVTESSLASRVCNMDPSLSVASGQTVLVEQIEQYLRTFFFVSTGWHPLWCGLPHLVPAHHGGTAESCRFRHGRSGAVDEMQRSEVFPVADERGHSGV